MNLNWQGRSQARGGHILLVVLVMVGISLLAAAALYSYTSSSELVNQRNNDYSVAVSAAEAATEKVLAQVISDFQNNGGTYVLMHTNSYSQMVPLASESASWSGFDFMDLSGNTGSTEIQYVPLSGYPLVNSQYGPLHGFTDQLRILSNARAHNSLSGVIGSVYQDINLTQVPIFQYAIFYNVTLEFTPLPPMTVIGPVHCNTNIYLNPFGTLTFMNDVTCSGTIVQGINPASPMPPLGGTVVFNGAHDSGLSTLRLPIGTNNSPAAVQQVIQIPPALEDPNSAMGLQRYYNKADLIILVGNTNILAESGRSTFFARLVPTNELSTFVSTNVSFYNKREAKTVRAIQIDVGGLVRWNATNVSVSPFLPLHNVGTVFVADVRTLASTNEPGIRLVNGTNLPPLGLTVATPDPLYIQGNYNAPASALGTTNTTGTLPASIAADAITILSVNWSDANSSLPLASRIAGSTTVNAAFLTGIVASTSASDSGGVENFPRFLEDWSSATLTYNGSMVCMFYSAIATGMWQGIGPTYDIYNPPTRNWGLDQNFQYQNKLPPSTPSLMILVRQGWHIPAAFTTNTVSCF
ncbi:conserved exported hypothetical protein [Verrucomicrobia bacterium]|nr:conserved exported hypothetical protein [Verrucomicrobiota bacterium]